MHIVEYATFKFTNLRQKCESSSYKKFYLTVDNFFFFRKWNILDKPQWYWQKEVLCEEAKDLNKCGFSGSLSGWKKSLSTIYLRGLPRGDNKGKSVVATLDKLSSRGQACTSLVDDVLGQKKTQSKPTDDKSALQKNEENQRPEMGGRSNNLLGLLSNELKTKKRRTKLRTTMKQLKALLLIFPMRRSLQETDVFLSWLHSSMTTNRIKARKRLKTVKN